MSHLRIALADYLTLRRALGDKMDKAERLLGQLDASNNTSFWDVWCCFLTGS